MGYVPCQYFNAEGLQCETWIKFQDSLVRDAKENRFCPKHQGVTPSESNIANGEKRTYIDFVNDIRAFAVAELPTMDLLEDHLALVEAEYEKQKIIASTLRAVRADRLDKMTEEERAERRKIKVERAVKEKAPKRESKKEALEKVKASLGAFFKSRGFNPLEVTAMSGYASTLMNNGQSEESARDAALKMLS